MKIVNIEYENNLREKAYWKEYNLEFDKNWNSQIQHQYKVKQPLILQESIIIKCIITIPEEKIEHHHFPKKDFELLLMDIIVLIH